MNTKKILGVLFLTALGAFSGILVYTTVFPGQNKPVPALLQNDSQKVMFANLPAGFEAEQFDFTLAAENTIHAVVHLKNTKYRVEQYNPLYEWFYGDRYRSEPTPVVGFGSGVIISKDGYIVTNNHVVEGADKMEVTLNDRRTYTAEIVGTDPSTDIAVVKIKEDNLPFIPFGDSDKLKLGEWVLAVGNPFNLTSTVTAGIVSAKGRNLGILPDQYRVESFIQTDAALNAGNSGGALVNVKGDLVGINTAIISPNGAYSGNSFAVPVNIVKKVVADLLEYGAVQRAVMGVSILDITSEVAKEYKLDAIEGVLIAGITDGGAAMESGIKEGDVVIAINNVKVNSVAELQEQISRYRPKDKISVLLKRDNKEKHFDVVLRNKEGDAKLLVSSDVILGAQCREISADLKRKLGVQSGVQITDLQDGRFRDAGIKEGFVITQADGKEITSVQDLKNVIGRKSQGTTVEVEGIYPGGRYVYVYVLRI